MASLLFIIPTYSFGNQIYDQALNETVNTRSTFVISTNQRVSYADFLKYINTDTKIFVHMHGCSGVGPDEQVLQNYYMSLNNSSMIIIDFFKRPGVSSSCPSGKFGSTIEARSTDRIHTRRAEAEILVNDLYSKGFKNIYVSGHSEGGRVASSWSSIPVKGIIIHGMDCKLKKFWKILDNQKTIVLLTKNDEWLSAQRDIVSCQTPANTEWVKEVFEDGHSHRPLIGKLENELSLWLGEKL
jgi:hypothetical protein